MISHHIMQIMQEAPMQNVFSCIISVASKGNKLNLCFQNTPICL